jgi:hypothetical protein
MKFNAAGESAISQTSLFLDRAQYGGVHPATGSLI